MSTSSDRAARLAEFGRLCMSRGGKGRLEWALGALREHLRAGGVYVVYGYDDEFRASGAGAQLDLTPTALWLIQRELVSRQDFVAFSTVGSRVVRFRRPESGEWIEWLASLLPVPGGHAAQMLLVHGLPQRGLDQRDLDMLVAAQPALAVLASEELYAGLALAQRDQLDALMDISEVVSEATDLSTALSKVARAVATVARVEYATIELVNADGSLTVRATNWEEPALDADRSQPPHQHNPLRDDVIRTQKAAVFPDVVNDERVPPGMRLDFARVLIRSGAMFPLVAGGELLGVLGIAATRPLAFDDAEIRLFERLARQTATVVIGVRLYGELAQKSVQLEHALAMERDRARRDPLTGVWNHAAITELLRERLEQRRDESLVVAMVDVDGLKAVNDTYGHLAGDEMLRLVAAHLSGGTAEAGRYGGDEFLVLLPGLDRAGADTWAERLADSVGAERLIDPDTSATIRVRASVGIAMFPDEAGSLPDLIHAADVAMYAQKSAHAFAEGDLSRRLNDRVSNVIAELLPLLTSRGDLPTKLRLVADRLSSGAGYHAVDCQIFDEAIEKPAAESTVLEGDESSLAERWMREQREGPKAARERAINLILARTHRPIILDDLSSDSRLSDAERQLLAASGLQSAIVAPMLSENELIGTLAVARREKAAFDVPDAQFLAAVANQVTAIVRMAALVDGMQEAADRLSNAHAETVLMLAAAAEAHDYTTGQHLQRIREITEALARQMGYPDDDVRALGLAATLHDIGKISVPDAVLASPLRFDSDDWEVAQMRAVMNRHSVWGAEFLAGREGFELATRVARWHHERWDGHGYPDGLFGVDLPEEVTIVTVADAFDAMVSDRPYRARRSVAAAIQEFIAASGKQFNAAVVEALVALWRSGALARYDEPLARAA